MKTSLDSTSKQKPAGASMKSRIIFWFTTVTILITACLAGYLWIALHWAYSSGERAGYVQKFSRKGWLCKTWEGELSMMPVPGAIPEKFFFSVRDVKVAAKINDTMGKKVGISYEQHIGLPTTCFGETEYFITEVKVLE